MRIRRSGRTTVQKHLCEIVANFLNFLTFTRRSSATPLSLTTGQTERSDGWNGRAERVSAARRSFERVVRRSSVSRSLLCLWPPPPPPPHVEAPPPPPPDVQSYNLSRLQRSVQNQPLTIAAAVGPDSPGALDSDLKRHQPPFVSAPPSHLSRHRLVEMSNVVFILFMYFNSTAAKVASRGVFPFSPLLPFKAPTWGLRASFVWK